ncbi:hypothetical protein SGL43_03325 [Streptomyces globisporus]|uniref:HIT family protein n=1 Tax=Streptomyces globisporus TaxID=1908 RepID=A0ABM9GXG6_STRGL|nr:hypothetical protein SGL43_03325 [Streptomyces globisporus]
MPPAAEPPHTESSGCPFLCGRTSQAYWIPHLHIVTHFMACAPLWG